MSEPILAVRDLVTSFPDGSERRFEYNEVHKLTAETTKRAYAYTESGSLTPQ